MADSLLSALRRGKGPAGLRRVAAEDRADRSAPNLVLSTPDVLADEDERHRYFFSSGANTWCSKLGELTFSTTLCALTRAEAQIIVSHWEDREREIARLVRDESDSAITLECGNYAHPNLDALLSAALVKLAPMQHRLQIAIQQETAKSPAGRAFVKLSTRSPKDSKKALLRAKIAYEERIQTIAATSAAATVTANERWKILSEEVTKAGSVQNSTEAMELLLDSARVYEDLEYALRGTLTGEEKGQEGGDGWRTCLCARAWDPRITPQSEFRGIVWGGKLTCLCQYFHPLFFPELEPLREKILADIQATFASEQVSASISRLGGNCIIDFAWLPEKVIVIELNPFDGVCLGTFPASTGLFLWDDPDDRKIMKGEADFEFRIRDAPLADASLKNQCNPDWRDIVYG